MKFRETTIVGLLFAILACGAWSQDQPQTAQSPAGDAARATQAPLAAPETIVSPQEAKELFRSVDEILQFVSKDTGLPIDHKVKRRLTKRDDVQSYIVKSMKDDKDAKRLERSSAVLKKFGLLPRNFDLSNFLVVMLREQVAGYYDVKTKTVNLLNWVDAEQQKPVLAHELTHALQDQSFGIEKWMKGSSGKTDKKDDPSPADIINDEESSARQAVIEGRRWWCCSIIPWRRPARHCSIRRKSSKRSRTACSSVPPTLPRFATLRFF